MIPSKETTLKMIYWLKNNPLEPSDSLFIHYHNEIQKWNKYRSIKNNIHAIRGMKELLNENDYLYYREIQILYIDGQIAYEIENNKNRNFEINSCYFAVQIILDYCKNLIKKDQDLKNKLLEKYILLERQGKLKEHITQLFEEPITPIPL